MRKLLLGLMFCALGAQAQNEMMDSVAVEESYFDAPFQIQKSVIDTFEYKDIKYLVYPYRFEADADYLQEERENRLRRFSFKRLFKKKVDYSEYSEEAYPYADSAVAADYIGVRDGIYRPNSGIPPVLDSLPTGTYVLLKNPTITKKNKKKNPQPIVLAIFKIDRGLLNGEAYFLDSEGYKTQEGIFVNGSKNGEWKEYDYCDCSNEKNEKKYLEKHYTYEKYTSTESYVKGVLQGPYKIYSCDNEHVYLQEEGEYSDGRKHGKIKEYEWNGTTSYVVAEYEALYGEYTNYYISYHRNGNIETKVIAPDSVFSVERRQLPYVNINPTPRLVKKKGNTSYYEGVFVLNNVSVPTGVPFVVYYNNGNVYGRFKKCTSHYGDDSYSFDTLFNEKGIAKVFKIALSDTLNKKRYSIVELDSNNLLGDKTNYVETSAGSYSVYESYGNLGGKKLQVISANYELLMPENWRKTSKDTLVLTRIYEETKRKGRTYYNTILEKEFKKTVDLKYNFSTDFEVSSHEPYHEQYSDILNYENLKLVVYHSRDTMPHHAKQITPQKYLQKFYGYGHYDTKNYSDSLVLYKDEKPFSGNLSIQFKLGSKIVKTSSNKIEINLTPIAKAKSVRKWKRKMRGLLRSYVVIEFKDGSATYIKGKINEGRKSIKGYAELKNSMPHGKVFAIQKKKRKKSKDKVKMLRGSMYEGMPHGKMYEYEANKKGKLYLKEIETYYMGEKRDTSFKYREDGKIKRFVVYDSLGKEVIECAYFKDGKIRELNDNRVIEGRPTFSYTLGEKGDTTTFSTKMNGKLNGLSYYTTFDEERKISTGDLSVHYKDDKPQGKLVFRDGWGTKRLELNIDSCYEEHEFSSGDVYDILKRWENSPSFIFAGKVKMFHPAGRTYCEGQMAYEIIYPSLDSTKIEPVEEFRGPEDPYDESWRYKSSSENGAYAERYKTGVWTYHDPAGIMIAEVDYSDTTDLILGMDTTRGIAGYKAFYDNGKLRYEGRLIDEDEMEDCESDLPEKDFEVYYKTYIAKNGDVMVKNGNGTLQTYYINEMLRYEGDLLNGRKNGWWKEYSKEGKIIAAGKYINGDKHGRWLYGDLTGINFLDDRCFESEEKKQKIQEMIKYNLEIEEEVYDHGVLVNRQTYSFTRSE